MEKSIRTFENFEQAENAERTEDDQLSYQQRFTNFMQLMAPHYAACQGFQRVYRVEDLYQRSVCDDWGLRLQPISKPTSDG
jgi:hypothetical protein